MNSSKLINNSGQSLLFSFSCPVSNGGSQPTVPAPVFAEPEFFQNKLLDTIQFMDVLTLKDSLEKDNFFRKLPTLASQLPRPIVLMKVSPELPQLRHCFNFHSFPALYLLSYCLKSLLRWSLAQRLPWHLTLY